jgi:phosphatidylserine/phosphatidylglycerophosphate/cardiolipin synthase-like enzyme
MKRIVLLILFACAGWMQAQTLPPVEVHYSPAENLEPLDVAALDKAQHSVDMVAYAFDDEAVASELLTLAKRGVNIRIYRDQQQYQGEQARAKKNPAADLMARFKGMPNVHIKVKGTMALAHLKSYCVDCGTTEMGTQSLVRDGSANWSVQGERVQDNSLVFLRGDFYELSFDHNFLLLWYRTNNQTIQ